jgi:hypothetical protein
MIERVMFQPWRKLWKLEDRLWRLKCARNLRWPLEPRPKPLAIYRSRAASALAPTHPPDLCVVVTTHRQPESCARLIDALHASLLEAGQASVFVLMLNDPSDCDYAPVLNTLARCFTGRFSFHEASRWLGKQGRSSAFQHAFDANASTSASHTLFLDDDVTFDPTFVGDALTLGNGIEDPAKTVLYLVSMKDDEPAGRWIHFERLPSVTGTSRLMQ